LSKKTFILDTSVVPNRVMWRSNGGASYVKDVNATTPGNPATDTIVVTAHADVSPGDTTLAAKNPQFSNVLHPLPGTSTGQVGVKLSTLVGDLRMKGMPGTYVGGSIATGATSLTGGSYTNTDIMNRNVQWNGTVIPTKWSPLQGVAGEPNDKVYSANVSTGASSPTSGYIPYEPGTYTTYLCGFAQRNYAYNGEQVQGLVIIKLNITLVNGTTPAA